MDALNIDAAPTELMPEADVSFPLSHTSRSIWYPPLMMLLLGGLCLVTIDFPVGYYLHTSHIHHEFARLLDAAEHFGTPFGQVFILLVAAALGNWREFRIARIFAGATCAGLVVDLFKMCVARTRPRAFKFSGHTIFDGFTGMFPLGAGGSAAQSFPSAHTASAIAFAIMLGWAYPKGRSMFLGIASLVALQRVCSGAHFPSDVLIGAALGWLVASQFIANSACSRWWDKVERRIVGD